MIVNKKLLLKYTLVWFFASIVLIVLAMFDKISMWLANVLRIETPINAVIVAVFAFVLLILFALTVTISKNVEQIRELTQEVALLRKAAGATRARPTKEVDDK
ncbi:MAG: DUF2304 domain-containing protein [Oscillospiraceae bacterium]|nr:DUF2304 domain-containing protein [Oscillospiraceae bacterium]